jgi:hypothetical protein
MNYRGCNETGVAKFDLVSLNILGVTEKKPPGRIAGLRDQI